MNILLLAKDYPPTIGGVENYSYYLAEGLGKTNAVKVVTFRGKNNENTWEDNVSVKRINLGFKISEVFKGVLLFFSLFICLLKERVDVVYATTWKVAIPAAVLKWMFRYELMITCHGAEVTRHKKSKVLMSLMNWVFCKSDKIVAVSAFTKSKVHEYSDVSDRKVTVVYNGIDSDKLKPYSLIDARRKLLLPENKFIITTISRVDSRKGHELVIRSIPKIIEQQTDFLYVIVGNGPNKSYLETLVKDLKLDDFVLFKGFVASELLDFYYSATNLFVMVNTLKDDKDFEGFGLVFAEAGYYSKPVIGGKNGGPCEVILDGKTGFLVEESISEIEERILYFMNNKNKLIEFGSNAFEWTNNMFTIDKMIEGITKVVLE
ncbi:glycosyltransferase family 4 protein [Saccharicrinis fermentans]|uniref:GDP-mannose-dependent alpha-(1-6)-phosphatidylinositol monomannoside mannosyltransferase n=1 Tax=Saccharicrinis fermentans DSM 9555 = JCM 21142 TaxID=869213 RepID=W7YC21_9BACT|nr:glycosyltransferase family 4 protein [Saccharicrinis fermentans]GAF02036.1 GDP-mannose-dependent alpha-(1-6)-phosphatidylinositol monomannoside mannosyltransferase [Saccharicrinis fermentans DSM 9555 = JCM 21142]